MDMRVLAGAIFLSGIAAFLYAVYCFGMLFASFWYETKTDKRKRITVNLFPWLLLWPRTHPKGVQKYIPRFLIALAIFIGVLGALYYFDEARRQESESKTQSGSAISDKVGD